MPLSELKSTSPSDEHFHGTNQIQLTHLQTDNIFYKPVIPLSDMSYHIYQSLPTLMTINHYNSKPPASKQSLKEFLKFKARNKDGVEFYNSDENLIKIPWVHASKKNWSADYCQIFTDWANNTGKPTCDVKKCKANFRCALNSLSDIIEVTDLSKKDGLDSYRVYEIKKDKLISKRKKATKRKDVTQKHHLRLNSSLFESPPTSPSYYDISSDCPLGDLSILGFENIDEVETLLPPTAMIPLPVLNLKVDDNGGGDDEYKPKRSRKSRGNRRLVE